MNYQALDEALKYIEEGLFFDSKAREGKPRKKAIAEAKKYNSFVEDFLNNKYDLGYNDAETIGTVLAAYYANIPASKILSVFSSGKNKALKRVTIKKYFEFPKNVTEDDDFYDIYEAFVKAKFDITEEISIIFNEDLYPYTFYRCKDSKLYFVDRSNQNTSTVKQCNIYTHLTPRVLEHLADTYFSKEEFEIATKE